MHLGIVYATELKVPINLIKIILYFVSINNKFDYLESNKKFWVSVQRHWNLTENKGRKGLIISYHKKEKMHVARIIYPYYPAKG